MAKILLKRKLTMSELVKITIMPLHDAKDVQAQLKRKGVDLVFNHDDATCRSGCQATVEVYVEGTPENLKVVQEYFQDHYGKILKGHNINWEAMEAVFDPSKSEATCPACGANFSTKLTECPDCGLVLG